MKEGEHFLAILVPVDESEIKEGSCRMLECRVGPTQETVNQKRFVFNSESVLALFCFIKSLVAVILPIGPKKLQICTLT